MMQNAGCDASPKIFESKMDQIEKKTNIKSCQCLGYCPLQCCRCLTWFMMFSLLVHCAAVDGMQQCLTRAVCIRLCA